jgi:hypothetical protein
MWAVCVPGPATPFARGQHHSEQSQNGQRRRRAIALALTVVALTPSSAVAKTTVRSEARAAAPSVVFGAPLATRVSRCDRTSPHVRTCQVTVFVFDDVSEEFAACAVHVRVYVERKRVVGSRTGYQSCSAIEKADLPTRGSGARRRGLDQSRTWYQAMPPAKALRASATAVLSPLTLYVTM